MPLEHIKESSTWAEIFRQIDRIVDSSSISPNSIFIKAKKYFADLSKKLSDKTLHAKYLDFREGQDLKEGPISDVNALEMGEFLLKNYPRFFTSKFDFNLYTHHYIYYYQSGLDSVKPAIICFNIENHDWSEGILYYLRFENDSYNYSSNFKLEKILPYIGSEINPEFIYFKATSSDFPNQVNMFTFNIAKRQLERRYLFFITSLAITNSTSKLFPSANFGIVVKINKKDILNEINNPIDPWISNSLMNKRITFGLRESHVYSSYDKFLQDKFSDDDSTNNKQYTSSNIIKGYYIGYYLRNEILNEDSIDSGGLASVILNIKSDGYSSMHFYRSFNSEAVKYKGYLRFPLDNYNTVEGFFEAKQQQNIFRINLFLNAINDHTKYGGIIAGFKTNSLIPFSSPIVFYKINDLTLDLNSLMLKYKPSRISKYNLLHYFKDIFGDKSTNKFTIIKKDLLNIYKNNIDSATICFLDE